MFDKSRPLRVVTLCSGYDSQCMALERLKERHPEFEYDLIAWSEIDKYAIKAHDAVFPQYAGRNLGDMTKIDWSTVPDFDFLTYSTPCFVAGTLVLTDSGYKPIEDITDNDSVLTHTNKFQRVVRPMSRPYGGHLLNINAMPFNELVCTPEHPFYIRRRMKVWDNAVRRWRRVFGEPEWVSARDLDKSTYLGVAINRESEYPKWGGTIDNRWGHGREVNNLSSLFTKSDFWYLMGRYVGDGWKRSDEAHHVVTICCGGRNRQRLFESIVACGFRASISKERTVEKFNISSKELCEFVGRYGYYAHGKRIDAETMNLPVTELEHFIKGYEDSDGCVIGKVHKIASVSRELIFGIAQCIAKVYRQPYRIYKTERKPKTVIEGRDVNQRDSWQVYWKEHADKQDKAFYEDGYIWAPIKEITAQGPGTVVYNMEVETDNSYTANGVIVHNCTDLSNAGLQKGMEEGSGTRSSILWYTRNAIIAKRPKYLMLENVQAMVSGKFFPYFLKWLAELTEYGYRNYWQVLNAKDYGVPQNRERVFVISILGEHEPYYFPPGRPLERRLMDVLEEKVDEKYYLPQEKVDQFIAQLDEEKLKLIAEQ